MAPTSNSPSQRVRLQAFLSRAGVASRRASEELIIAGRVSVNGKTAEIGSQVDPSADTVRVDHKVVSARAPTGSSFINHEGM